MCRTFCHFLQNYQLDNYCHCYSLRNGVISISIYCMIFAFVDVIFAALLITLEHDSLLGKALFFFVILDLCINVIMFAFAITLMIGACKFKVKLILAWILYAIFYIFCKISLVTLTILHMATVTKNHREIWQYVDVIEKIAFIVYYIYSEVICFNYMKILKKDREKEIERARLSDEEEDDVIDADAFFVYDSAERKWIIGDRKRSQESESHYQENLKKENAERKELEQKRKQKQAEGARKKMEGSSRSRLGKRKGAGGGTRKGTGRGSGSAGKRLRSPKGGAGGSKRRSVGENASSASTTASIST